MSLMKIDLSNKAELKEKLEIFKCASDKIPPTWKSSHFGLLMKARAKASASSSKDDDVKELPMEKAEVDKVFRDKEKECGHMKAKKVKPLQFDLIINYMRSNRSSMSVHSLHRIISEFCGDASNEFCIQRSEAWNFIMEHLEEYPPLNLESRKFWMELVSFGKSPVRRCEDLVKAFSNSCLEKFGRYEDVSYEYQLFLLELLEWDFAAVLSNFDSSAIKNAVKQKAASRPARTKIDLSSMDNLELIPLAFTVICVIKKGDLIENALDQEHLYETFGGLFEKSTDLCSKKLYARLIGLLFDVHLFVSNKDMYFTVFNHKDLPASCNYRQHMRKVRTQLAEKHDDFQSAENYNLFAGLLDVKWCSDLILSFSET